MKHLTIYITEKALHMSSITNITFAFWYFEEFCNAMSQKLYNGLSFHTEKKGQISPIVCETSRYLYP